jgi:hypothetical protein
MKEVKAIEVSMDNKAWVRLVVWTKNQVIASGLDPKLFKYSREVTFKIPSACKIGYILYGH